MKLLSVIPKTIRIPLMNPLTDQGSLVQAGPLARP